MGESGRYSAVKIGATLIRGQDTWNLTRSAKEVDDSEFGSEWEKKDLGMMSWKADFNGKVRLDDAGQQALEDAFENKTLLSDLRLYVNTTVYYAPNTAADSEAGGRVSELTIGAKHDGVATVKISISGNGPVKKFGA